MQTPADPELLGAFRAQLVARVPHIDGGGSKVANPTPLVDMTEVLLQCARSEYGMRLRAEGGKVYGKFDSKIHGGSVKVRPAVRILEDAIASGKLARGQTVFEATSGNFGLALGMLRVFGFDVVALVSRKLQSGVTERLQREGVKLVNLDIDICPAPGMQVSPDLAMAKGVAASVGQQLGELGFERGPFDNVRTEAEELLAMQDAIGLAKLLSKAYGGFCPEQYDNELNVEVHEKLTGPELDQQLELEGASLEGFVVACAFGTGGTATGISRYVSRRYGRKGVRVVFPQEGQDVGGIRTRGKAEGLRFYQPREYLGEHEVNFEETRGLLEYFNRKGYDVGESGALVLYACMQMLNYGLESRLVAMVADGADKYAQVAQETSRRARKDQVTVQEAASGIREYAGVVWAHNMFVPREEGVKLIASSLGCDAKEVKVARTEDVQAILNGRDPSEEFARLLPSDGRPLLVVCMAGNTSLMLTKVLERRGVIAQSLVGGITGLPESKMRQPFELVQIPRN